MWNDLTMNKNDKILMLYREETQKGVDYMIEELTQAFKERMLKETEKEIDDFIFNLRRSIRLEFERA